MTAIVVAQDFCFFSRGEIGNGSRRESERVKRKQENSIFCDMKCFDTFHFHVFNEWLFKWEKWKLR